MLEITPVKAFKDNFIWMLHNPGSETAVAVDPGQSEPVLAWLKSRGLRLSAILITHKHIDHTGGVMDLQFAFPKVAVFGPAHETIRGIKSRLKEGDHPDIPGLQADFEVMEVPGHTEGHIAYYGEGVLFCGDTLFSAGCGGIFGGTHEQMHDSLQRIAALPPETQLYCAHEYTLANLGFAKWVEPESKAIPAREQEAQALLAKGENSVPSLLQTELQTNPFLRVGLPNVKAAAEKYVGHSLADGAEVFTAVRRWKDREYD
ncbi:hydroxyacylglutathione hydrolase [Sedimenticola selenatireducens]|jgi:hydroxyacylglutathione hydrolase|uniref:Hydroxyacylglutathione hydrolase n=1 Tax=Sedimenticola selenatireducens TaxID=191960 RepID=A0A557SLS3_9GAMM|nr:hydroxyacylglutathione hydrolase [Sedimenticola selenatireducens]TVO78376.1 hydroxyacylglutathione hydrolase [Sedimenticola selenatireducens]TVT62766.1 MAG: hydroxyacylglutathione hydrolase [Sedimenticola selenatireducens]